MNIKSAEFEISNTDVKKCPEGFKPERKDSYPNSVLKGFA